MKTLKFPGEPETKSVGTVTRLWPAGALRVTCNGRCSMDLAYFRKPTAATLEFTGTTKATVECGLDLDELRKSDLVEIATAMGIDHAGRKADLLKRIRFDDTGNLTRGKT